MVKRKRGETPIVKIEEGIAISDWLIYLQQISNKNVSHYFTFYSMLIGFSAALIALSVYANTRLEGLSILDYETITINENVSRVVFNLNKQFGFIEYAHLIIIVGATIFIAVICYFFNRSKKFLKAKAAEKLQLSILSIEYSNLKNVVTIELAWKKLLEEIEIAGLSKRSKLLNKKSEQQFDEWFNMIIKRISPQKQK